VPVLEPHPEGYQQENWLLDPGRWRKVRRMAPNELTQFTDPTSSLWIDRNSSLKGQNDQIPPCKFADIDNSLRLIKIDRVDVRVFTYYSKRRGQGVSGITKQITGLRLLTQIIRSSIGKKAMVVTPSENVFSP